MESLLKEKLHLSRLKLGRLSWYWAGHTYIQVDPISLASGDGRLIVRDAALLVRISTWDLLRGNFRADSLRLKGGSVRLAAPNQPQGPIPLPALRVQLEDVALEWQALGLSGNLEHLYLQLNTEAHRLDLNAPKVNLRLLWTATHKPTLLHARFGDMHWLPPAWRSHLVGGSSGEIIAEKERDDWRLRLNLRANNNQAFLKLQGAPTIPFQQLQATVRLYLAAGGFVPVRVNLERLFWQGGGNHLELTGGWQQGRLAAKLQSGQLALATFWPWLAGLGEETWRAWLASMHAGRVEALSGNLSLAWPDLLTPPPLAAWQKAKFALRGKVRGADITLDIGGRPLTGVTGEVMASNQGLKADVVRAQLPLGAGRVKGRLVIRSWQTPLLEVDGEGDVDIGRLLKWLDEKPLPSLHWRAAKARARFSLHWMPEESEPRQGSAVLVPAQPWLVHVFGFPMEVDSGRVRWDAKGGIHIEDIAFTTDLLRGRLSAHGLPAGGGTWRLANLRLHGQSNFAKLVGRINLPVRSATGKMQTDLAFDGRWSLSLDLTHAAWRHFLGSHKRDGERFFIHSHGELTGERFKLLSIKSRGQAMMLAGSGTIGPGRWRLNIQRLVTPAADIAVDILSPAGAAPVAVEIDAAYFTEDFLPDPLPKVAIGAKPWVLHARAKQARWGNASMRGIDLRMTSANLGVGLLHADRIEAANLSVDHVRALFYRPNAGTLDVRLLSANLLGQHLELSAILVSEGGRAIRWSGFAQLSGDFTPIVQQLDAAQHFREGEMHALISGRGRLQKGSPWWQELEGRLRLRVDHGRILEGGTMTRLLAAASLADLPKLLTLNRKDLVGKGIFYKRLQLEAELHGNKADIRKLAMRSSALDMAGHGDLDLASGNLDLLIVLRPLQNLDAILGAIPLLRDILGGAAHSLLRKVYHVHGPLSQATVEPMDPEAAGLAAPGLIERLITWPSTWFGE